MPDLGRRGAIALAAALLLMIGFAGANAAILSKADALKLATARANGDPALGIAMIVDPGGETAVARLVVRLGGSVLVAEPRFGFLSLVLPPGRFADLARDPSVQAIGLDAVKGVDAPIVELSGAAPAGERQASAAEAGTLLAEDVAADHASLLKELDAEEMLAEHPTFDGRGVTIAHVESAPDFLAPELKTARDLQGRVAGKFRDVISVPRFEPQLKGDPAPAGPDAWRWVKLSPPRRAVAGSIKIDGRAYRVPTDGERYRTGVIDIPPDVVRLTGGQPPASGASRRAVLWDGRRAWLDQAGDGDFRHDQPVADFSVRQEFGVLGTDNPATEVRESLGYAIHQYKDYLGFTFGMSSHASGVAGYAAASKGDGGRVEGVAPGAQLISISHANTISSFSEALITAFESPADVVLLESQYPTLGSYDLRDGRSVVELLLQRLIAAYDKPCFITAGNDAGLGSAWDPTPADAIDVGAFQSAEVTRRHFGLRMSRPVAIHWATSEGPTGTGALKPDLIAPVLHLSTSGGFEAGGEFPGLYKLPPGYQVFLGTSGATPVAAGAAALIISAAKQTGAPHGGAAVIRAMRDGAQFHAGIAATQQGAGSIDVAQAWDHLRSDGGRAPADVVDVQAPLRTASSAWIKPPNGPGLYETIGWSPGRAEDRTILLTRRSGAAAPTPLTLTWIGNEAGAFSGPPDVTLPLGQATPLKVRIAPGTAGSFSAILELREPASRRVLARIPFTIVVPAEPETSGVAAEVTLERPGRQDVFIDVPPLTDALQVSVDMLGDHWREPDGAFIQVLVRSPDGLRSTYLWPDPATQDATLSFDQPVAGPWQINFLNLGGYLFHGVDEATVDHLRYRLSIIRAAASGDPNGDSRWTNLGAPLDGGVLTTALGRRSTLTGEIGPGDYRIETIDVPPASDLLILDLAATGREASDVDLYLFKPTGGRYLPFRKASDRGGNGRRIVVRAPEAGTWKVMVDGAFAEAATAYTLSIVQSAARNGALVTDDSIRRRETGASWTVSARPTPLPTSASGDLVSIAYVDDPNVYSLHEAEISKRPFVLLRRHAEPILVGLRLTPVNTPRGGARSVGQH